jgi:hypothetical protein
MRATCPAHLNLLDLITLKIFDEGKIVPVLNRVTRYEDVWGNGSTAPRILTLALDGSELLLYPQGKSPLLRFTLDRKNSLPGIETQSSIP